VENAGPENAGTNTTYEKRLQCAC